jgi:hypothetical protein
MKRDELISKLRYTYFLSSVVFLLSSTIEGYSQDPLQLCGGCTNPSSLIETNHRLSLQNSSNISSIPLFNISYVNAIGTLYCKIR